MLNEHEYYCNNGIVDVLLIESDEKESFRPIVVSTTRKPIAIQSRAEKKKGEKSPAHERIHLLRTTWFRTRGLVGVSSLGGSVPGLAPEFEALATPGIAKTLPPFTPIASRLSRIVDPPAADDAAAAAAANEDGPAVA